MPDALTWTDDAPVLSAVHGAYRGLLERALTVLLSQEPLDGELRGLTASVDAIGIGRALVAPETSRRLLWRGVPPDAARAFLVAALRSERARADGDAHVPRETWTALVDMRLGPGRDRFEWPMVPGMMPLDFGSPCAATIDLSGRAERVATARPLLATTELDAALAKLLHGLAAARAVCGRAAEFMARFTKVLVVQKDEDNPSTCSSGSSGQFVGRSFVTNIHRDDVTEEAVVDAVLHESIHSLLYMEQLLSPWGPAELIQDQSPCVRSPWTGRPLPVRSFVEASFVWYGLLHFWCHALDAPAFAPGQVRFHLTRSLRGFLGQTLTDLLGDALGVLAAPIVATLSSMQARVRDAYRG